MPSHGGQSCFSCLLQLSNPEGVSSGASQQEETSLLGLAATGLCLRPGGESPCRCGGEVHRVAPRYLRQEDVQRVSSI